MLVYNELFKQLADHGWSSYRLRKEGKLAEGTLSRLRHGQPVSTETIDVICSLCKCQPGDLLTWTPDPEE